MAALPGDERAGVLRTPDHPGKNRDAELRLLLNEITSAETYMFPAPRPMEALRK